MATEKNQEQQQFEKIETEKKKGNKTKKVVICLSLLALGTTAGFLAGNKNARTKVKNSVKNTFSKFGSKKSSESPATTEQPVVDNNVGGSVEQPQQQFSYGGNNGERKYRTTESRRFNNFNN